MIADFAIYQIDMGVELTMSLMADKNKTIQCCVTVKMRVWSK